MSADESGPRSGDDQRIVDLVRLLRETESKLQKLTGGELDSVAVDGGKTYLLAEAQERLRASEDAQRAAKETLTAILDALPAHIALIDEKGVILRVNEAWSRFATANALQGSSFGVGLNYVEICERTRGECSEEALEAGAGIRRVLGGGRDFHLDYPCHSPGQRQWFRLSATPLFRDRNAGAVVMHIDITERKLAAEALRVTVEEFRTLAESMPQIVWMTRPNGLTVYFNHHWMDYTGLTLDESLGEGWSKPYHPEDRPVAENAWRNAVSTTSAYMIESRLRRADGEYRWWLIRAVPQVDASGNVLKWFGTCTDIHALKLAELEILRSNRALLMLSSCNEKLMKLQSEDELLTEICRVVTEIGGYRMAWVGYARDDEHCSIEKMASAGDLDGYLDTMKISWSASEQMGLGPGGRAIRSGQPEVCRDVENDPFFTPFLDPMRSRGCRAMICLPLRNDTRVFGILALYSANPVDVEEKEMNLLMDLANNVGFGIEHLRAIRKTEEQAALLDAASDAIILRSIDNKIIFWNEGAKRLFGWDSSEVLGDDPRQIYIRDISVFDEAMNALLKAGNWSGELVTISKDGRKIFTDARWTLLRDDEGHPKAILAINSDITQQKKLETQLLRVQRMESIGTLAGGVAHDLNNILAPILMGTGVLKDEVESELGRQIVASMETSAQRGADLVRQVLAFARGVEGKRIPVNAAHILNELIEVIHDTFPKNIELIYTPGRDLWTATGDPTQMHQVFTNLCVNARDAMPHGGTLKVSTENAVVDDVYAGMNPESKPGPYVIVKIEDTGIGIPPNIREKIFEPFFTTKEIGKGTGLGLSTTIGIVKSHGGFINLYSEVGKGTTFKVYFPADTSPAAAEDTAIEQSGIPRGNGELVLLVDDESTIRSVAQKTLERYGYRVLLASNGAEAIARYAQYREQIAVVITDMAMPVMDGPATIVALKAVNPEVTIIGSSGLAANGGVAKAIGAGVKYFIPKPYTAESMLKVLHDALKLEN